MKNTKLTQKKAEKENNGTNSRWDRQKTNSKMMDINITVSISTLKIDGRNSSNKFANCYSQVL